ncbi:MAG: hypothetical protein MJB14_21000, partial [Spirochaetes bacterium]|nr:hypothetical protein [Spirochaetota bacterium]
DINRKGSKWPLKNKNVLKSHPDWKTKPELTHQYYYPAQDPNLSIDYQTIYFNEENLPVYYDCAKNFEIRTEQFVKIISVFIYSLDENGQLGERVFQDFQTASDSESYKIDRFVADFDHSEEKYIIGSGKYVLYTAVVDQFNKLYFFEPDYFAIKEPVVQVNNRKISNQLSSFSYDLKDLSDDLVFNTANDQIYYQTEVAFTELTGITQSGIYSNHELEVYDHHSGQVIPALITSDTDTVSEEQIFQVLLSIPGDQQNRQFSIRRNYQTWINLSGNPMVMNGKEPVVLDTKSILVNKITDAPSFQMNQISEKAAALTAQSSAAELKLWYNDQYRNQESPILDVEESLTARDFDFNQPLFDIPLTWAEDIHLFKITVESLKNQDTLDFYGKLNQNDNEIRYFAVKTTTDENQQSISQVVDLADRIIRNNKEITLKLYYHDFFTENTDDVAFPVTSFGNRFELRAEAVAFFTHNFFYNNPALADKDKFIYHQDEIDGKILQYIQSLGEIKGFFQRNDGISDGDENGISIHNQSAENQSFQSAPFPSRVVYHTIQRRVNEGDRVDLMLKPRLAGQLPGVDAYRIVAAKETELIQYLQSQGQAFVSGEGDLTGNQALETFLLNQFFNPAGSLAQAPADNQWLYENGIYVSDWIKNSAVPVALGGNDYDPACIFTFAEDSEYHAENKIHFFTAVSFTNETSKLAPVLRHSAINLDTSLSVIVNPDDLFDTENHAEIHEKIILTRDLYVPAGKTLTFGYGASLNTDKTTKKLAGVLLDNNVHIVVDGTLNITNLDAGSQGNPKKIYLGPTGLADSSTNDSSGLAIIHQNGMWGGIYILQSGRLNMDGGIISGAYDGIILHNNGNQSSLKNSIIKYNETGLHLYHSYPALIEMLFIEGNLLYGVKEDNMSNPDWVYPESELDNVKNNAYNYYDDQDQIIR